MGFRKFIYLGILIMAVVCMLSIVSGMMASKAAAKWHVNQIMDVCLEWSYEEAMVTVVSFDPIRRYLVIKIEGLYTEGSDSMNQLFSEMIWDFMKIDDRLIIEVKGEWIPSKFNPIDCEWAKFLLDGEGG